ncbi:MAG: glycosyl hydrolase family 18 protein [Clostridia bacterium]|nr:glycosyl hydrolase family 18 protein [Clostridia bacterium]
MNEVLKRVLCSVIFLGIIFVIFFTLKIGQENRNIKEAGLVVFGDNINADYKPFVDGDGIYVSVDTIKKLIDENIYYDKVATKIIVTTHDDVVKLKVGEKKISKNFEYSDIQNEARLKDNAPYVDINLLKELYHINVEYNEETSTISIDNTETSDIAVKYNNVNVYEKLDTKSEVLQILNQENKVTVYTESLKHNRWYKIKTDTGIIGYIAKNNVDVPTTNDNNTGKNNTENTAKEKITMFWQYGSNLTTLGNKIEGVDVVSPTWYELKNSGGDINSEYSKSYFDKAKANGYEIWPIITNGIDSASYTADDTSKMLNSEYTREKFIKNLVKLLKEHKVEGINMDFEAMKTDDKDLYTQLIREMAPILRKENIKLSVDMYFVAYIDRKRVGAASDYIILMGYDQRGAWSSEAGSIAEASWVEKNIESLLNDSKVPSDKIILGVPFYTRHWTVKAGLEKPTTKVYTMQDCLDFIKEYNLTPVWDQDAGQNYAEYTKGNVTYKLWMEDKDSIKRRVETVNKYNLAGITGWRKGLETSDIWNVIKENLK